ncbi:hypothetical protein CAEBREN_00876 [Caenorhabditis brenneri]|uniref:Uncharacterized protein n=1 Tax=Caenorhabditis brenneri TaxID=135651 RepID=G0NCK1_CAEBE|nr:hypothetical protein CAEBREN_00876 [Caenorhabditis brenneri]
MACVNFNAPLPTSKPPTCDCPSQYITNSTEPGYELNNFYVRGEISDDRCSWNISCANSRIAQGRVNGHLYKSHFFAGLCNGGTQKWIVASGDGILWQDVPIFEYSCVELL